MAEFKQIIDDALDILKFDGAVQDTLAELREKWGAQVPALLDERFDAVGVQYMKLSHEKGAAALGQELSAFGWALYNLDDEDEYLFVLLPEEERSEWERYCKKQGQYCHLMKQQGRKWGDHAKEQDPEKLMPCEEYILQDEYDYFFNSLAGDFAAGKWKNQDAEEWKSGCVADLRHRPPQVIRSHSLPHLGCLTYSAENELYAASRAAGSGTIGRALLSKNPATLNWAEPSPIGYDGPPRTLCWADHSLWVGDPTNATRIELTDRGTCQDVKNWILPEDGWSTKYHCGITTDGLGRVYFSNEWYKGQIYRWENGKVTKHTFSLDGYDHLSEAVPVPGTGRITMIHAVSGQGRMEECLLELDMDTGRCRIAPLPGMGEGFFAGLPGTGCWCRGTAKSSPMTLPSSSIGTPVKCCVSVRECSAGRKYSTLEYSPIARWSSSPGGIGLGRYFVIPSTSGASCGRQTSPKSWNGGTTKKCTRICPSFYRPRPQSEKSFSRKTA